MRRFWGALVVAAAWTCLAVPPAQAATPPSGAISPGGRVTWLSQFFPAAANVSNQTGPQRCSPSYPGGPNDPEAIPGVHQCDVFELRIDVPPGYWGQHKGGVSVTIDWSEEGGGQGDDDDDFDMFIYKKPPPGQPVGPPVASSTGVGGEGHTEHAQLFSPEGTYLVRANPFTVENAQFKGTAQFFSLAPLPSVAGGLQQFRASSTGYLSYSEPHSAVDPLEPNHLVAGSKMYQNLGEYKFKIGTFASFDGGETWRDNGHLPGYPRQKGDEGDGYYIVSDVWTAFDDEGNAYAMVLDNPAGGTTGAGWGMTLHKSTDGGQTWSGRIPIEEKSDPVTKLALLSDKNTLAVDNFGPDRDGKTGNMYACWSEDAQAGVAGANVFVAFKRSTDGGRTWGPNPPRNLSGADRTVIGCFVAVGPPAIPGGPGVVYVFWNDFGAGRHRFAKSVDGGQTFTPPATINTYTESPSPFPNSAFRNENIPAGGVDPRNGHVYLSYMDYHRTRTEDDPDTEEDESACPETPQDEAPPGQVCDADVMLVKSTDGGATWNETRPIRVNQDRVGNGKDQFQQQLAITDDGTLNMMWFDRRNDPQNFYIDTYAARSRDGGATWKETRVTRSMWDPSINPPISPSGQFIGDYQGLTASECDAVPFWNDTTRANLSRSDRRYSPYQEVFAAKVPNTSAFGGTSRPARCERPVTSKFVGCVNPAGGVRGRRLARARLGRGRRSQRRILRGRLLSRRGGIDRFCVAGGGAMRIGYPTRRLRRTHPNRARVRRMRGRALFIGTSSRRIFSRGLRVGYRTRTLRRRLRGEKRVRVGRNVWYMVPTRTSRLLFKTRRGRITGVGIGDKVLTRTRRSAHRFLHAWHL